MLESLQIPGLGDSSLLGLLIFWIPFIIIMLYGQRIQMYISLGEISRSLNKLKLMKEKSREEVIDFVSKISQSKDKLTEKIDQFLEYFTIQPISLDPAGIVKKLDHIVNVKDDRMRAEIKQLVSSATDVQTSNIENVIEVASALNYYYKAVRHFYLLGKKTMSYIWIVQLQMILPTILEESNALMKAITAFKQSQPIGDGIGAMVVGKMMVGKEKKIVSKETMMSESEYKGRGLYLIKAEGPGGNVGQPGNALVRMIDEMGTKIDVIIMIDAALKLEGEKTGEIAEGVGAAIGGIGVERFKIEEVASKYKIPLYAIVIKQSIIDAISVMKKEISETTEKVIEMVQRTVEEKAKEGDKVAVVGVGNTVGISQ
ncbi:MAG: DUF1512 domain-containing protein [Candidatus Methylarchaceae archaeon HK02M1]|nr:DUF1512 domain-containing protein [Candidatus Methylarchaceae archaeon HK02M1]